MCVLSIKDYCKNVSIIGSVLNKPLLLPYKYDQNNGTPLDLLSEHHVNYAQYYFVFFYWNLFLGGYILTVDNKMQLNFS